MTRTVDGVTWNLVYGAENRLVSMAKADESYSESYLYDGDGVRVARVRSGEATYLFMGGMYEITLTNPDDTVTDTKSYYTAAGQVIAMRGEDGLSTLLTDHLGSVVGIVDSTGSLVGEQRYLPFGEVRGDVGSNPSVDLSFTGQRALEGTGLLDYHARQYDPALRSFIQPDSIIPNPFSVLDYNRYLYVHANPVRFTDPSGNMLWEGDGGDYNWRIQADDEYLKLMDILKHWEADSAWGLMAGALRHEPHMDIVGKGLDEISTDHVVTNLEKNLVYEIEKMPIYGIEDFDYYDKTQALTFGETGNMFIDATLGQTWTVRAANIDSSAVVSVQKEIIIKFQVRDKFDLRPDWSSGVRTGLSGFLYNVVTTTTGAIWHDFLGASDQMTTSASWYTIR